MRGYRLHANTLYAKLRKSANEDGLEDGFNTPEWTVNAMISKEEIIKHIGAGVSWKWQSSFLWQSFLVNGQTPSYNTLDAKVSYTFNKINSKIKLGASNLLNHYYYSFLGGPSIGGMYYATVQYGL